MDGLTKSINQFAVSQGLEEIDKAELTKFMGSETAQILDNIAAHINGEMTLEELAASVGFEITEEVDE